MEATIQTVLFWLFSILGIAGGVGLVLNRNAVMSALCLIVNFFSIAGLYLSLQAEFLAVIQILVYAGAIMVLFLFVIMLLNMDDEQIDYVPDTRKVIALLLGFAFVAEMAMVFRLFGNGSINGDFDYGKVEPIGAQMMTNYLFPFEMISIILIAALIGAIVVARRYNYERD